MFVADKFQHTMLPLYQEPAIFSYLFLGVFTSKNQYRSSVKLLSGSKGGGKALRLPAVGLYDGRGSVAA